MIHHPSAPLTPLAQLTLRAHRPAPARVELEYRPAGVRFARTALWIVLCWGAMPMVFWVPPHYPWAVAALAAGVFLAYREWTGRYSVHSFAGICPRCGAPLSLGLDRTIDLPHTLTCFTCHFEPQLEVVVASQKEAEAPVPAHQVGECVGEWGKRWLADSPFIYCESCHAGVPWTAAGWAAASAENARGDLLSRLTDEGWPLI